MNNKALLVNSTLSDKVVIYSFPRAGTKLISNIFGQFGYYECGEWFDTYSSHVENGNVNRMSSSRISRIQDFSRTQPNSSRYFHTNKTIDRLRNFPQGNKQVVTLWHENFENCPFIINKLGDSLWLLPTRNSWDQLVSFMISHDNQNFNNADINKPIVISEWFFKFCFWRLQRISKNQEWISNNLNSMIIPFEELISGKFTGFNRTYSVTTVDENKNIESLVLNIDDVKSWYIELEKECKRIDTIHF